VATYLGTLRWRPDRNVTVYARAASGYRPGGPQTSPTLPVGAPTAIKPDTVWNYESGVKATLLDGQFSIDASVFHIDWDNIQLSTIYGGFVLQANGGKAQVDGLEMTARPIRNLTVSTNLGYTNSRLTRVDPGVSASIGAYAGDKLPLTPPWTVAMLADQKIPLSDTLTASLGGTVRMRSDMPSSFAGSTINPNVKIPSLTTLDLRAGLNFERYAVQFRVENVTNAFGYSSLVNNRVYAGQPSDTQATVVRPRMFTLGFSVRY
jgi:outer membrane receptor protein involved in Fe transport